MVQPHEGTLNPKSLQALLAQYLERQTAAHAAGLGQPASTDEVEPYDAIPARPVDARLAWTEATAALRQLVPDLPARAWKAPADWAALVASHEPVTSLAFALGNFPQLVRDLNPLWQASSLTKLTPSADARPLSAPTLTDWKAETSRSSQAASTLLAAGVLRVARQFDRAAELLEGCRATLPEEWMAAWANEAAALAWHRGHCQEALDSWRSQPDSVPVLFNRGMAALFLGHTAEARTALEQAARQMPEDGAWHHLARLYLALAEARG